MLLLSQPKYVFCRLDLVTLDGELLAMVHLMNIESAAVTGRGINCYYNKKRFGPSMIRDLSRSRPSENTVTRDVMDDKIRKSLFKIEGYRYSRSKTGVLSSRIVCTKRSDTSRNSVANDSQRKRCRKASIKSENCSGVLTINFFKDEPTVISCFHDYVTKAYPKFLG